MAVGNRELFVTFKVEKSRYFKRDGNDVHTDAEISLSQAVLGGTIRIQGVYEDQTIQIMPGSSSHLSILLKGKGIKRVNTTSTGDHYVHLKIVIPKKLTDEQKALLQAYAELEKETPGQIYGVTFKSDGKSSSSNNSETLSEKFTQREKEEEEKETYPDLDEFRKKRREYQYYFGMGVLVVIILALILGGESWETKTANDFHDYTIAKQRARKPTENPLHDA